MSDSARDTRQHITEAAQIEQTRRGVGACRAQQHMIGLMFSQYVIDEVGREQHLPPALLLYAGLALIPTAAFMALVATRPAVSPAGVWLIIAGNGLWAAASLLLLASGLVAPNAAQDAGRRRGRAAGRLSLARVRPYTRRSS